jgi:hypothetical protein
MTFFRVYENGKPGQLDNYLQWEVAGPKDGELVFVAGNPGRTSRLHTLDHLVYTRDVSLPYTLEYLRAGEKSLKEYSQQSPEHARQAEKELFSIQNGRKLFVGRNAGLQQGEIVEAKAKDEAALREKISNTPALKDHLTAWKIVSDARKVSREISLEHVLVEGRHGFQSELFSLARHLVRLAEEDQKPSHERLPEYQEARREELMLSLNSEAPVYTELEQWKLAHSLGFLQKKLSAGHVAVKLALEGKSPQERARQLVEGTRLTDPAYRAEILKGGADAIDASTDTMILLARAVDKNARDLRNRMETQVDEPEKQAYKLISDAIFQLYGTAQYPDATFTPRLAFGPVSGYEEGDKSIPAMTTLGGIFAHEKAHNAQPPWKIPARWHDARSSGSVAWDKSFNFVSATDIIGGNSGSPVLNRNGKLVGLIFDSNIHGLVWDYRYNDKQARAVSVASDGMVEALQAIYKTEDLVTELTADQP